MLQSAVFVTRPPSGFTQSARWPALIDMRRDQARCLALAGVAAAVGDAVLYAMEGSSEALDDFLRLLGVSPCETGATEVWRQTVTFRTHRVLALSHPPFYGEEEALLARALEADPPLYAEIPALMAGAALRWAMGPFSPAMQPRTRAEAFQ